MTSLSGLILVYPQIIISLNPDVMANWKRLHNADDVVGLNILLRENYPMGENVSHYAGIVDKCAGENYVIQTANGKVEIYPDDYTYHFIRIDEIMF